MTLSSSFYAGLRSISLSRPSGRVDRRPPLPRCWGRGKWTEKRVSFLPLMTSLRNFTPRRKSERDCQTARTRHSLPGEVEPKMSCNAPATGNSAGRHGTTEVGAIMACACWSGPSRRYRRRSRDGGSPWWRCVR